MTRTALYDITVICLDEYLSSDDHFVLCVIEMLLTLYMVIFL